MFCPSCNLDVKKPATHYTHKTCKVYFYECPNCNHIFAGEKRGMRKRLLSTAYITNKFPESVQALSPNTFSLYCDSLSAISCNLNRFSGIGLRVALENLLTDYLTKWKNLPISELPKTLNGKAEKINQLNAYLYADICMNVVRIFGNDSVHIETKFPTLNLSDAFLAFETLCGIIDTELRLIELNSQIKNTAHGKP